MTRALIRFGVAIQFCVAGPLCFSQPSTAPTDKGSPAVHADVAKFAGVWDGTFSQNTGPTNRPTVSYPMVLEIKPKQDREITTIIDWPDKRRGTTRTSGLGVATPNSVSWVEMTEIQGNAELFGRYIARMGKDGTLEGKYFTDYDSEQGGSFTLKPSDLQAIEAFKRENQKTIDRLVSVSKQIEFLPPSWSKVSSLATAWLSNRLGFDFKFVDEDVVPDREYAGRLAAAFEKRENLFAQNPTAEIPMRLQRTTQTIRSYLLSLPNGFGDGIKRHPLRISLHGSGGPGPVSFKTVSEARETPFVAVRPISDRGWNPSDLNVFLSEITELFPIDGERIYLTGGSMGGIGTYAWAMANPEHFAAISPVCGFGDLFRASRLKNIPVWIFHGEKDNTIPIHLSETMLAALQSCGGNVRHTFYPEAGHNISSLMDHRALDRWFLDHRRSDQAAPPDPMEEWQLGADGVGQKRIVTLPAIRVASIQGTVASRPTVLRLYDVYRKAGLSPRGSVQEQRFSSLPEGQVRFLLPVPESVRTNNTTNSIEIVELPSCRALSFAMATRFDNTSEKQIIESALKELAQKGEKPTGEIRTMNLTRNYQNHSVDRIDIILAQ